MSWFDDLPLSQRYALVGGLVGAGGGGLGGLLAGDTTKRRLRGAAGGALLGGLAGAGVGGAGGYLLSPGPALPPPEAASAAAPAAAAPIPPYVTGVGAAMNRLGEVLLAGGRSAQDAVSNAEENPTVPLAAGGAGLGGLGGGYAGHRAMVNPKGIFAGASSTKLRGINTAGGAGIGASLGGFTGQALATLAQARRQAELQRQGAP